jgi:hypothetical protein
VCVCVCEWVAHPLHFFCIRLYLYALPPTLARQGRPEEEKEEKESRSSASEQQGGEQEVYDR